MVFAVSSQIYLCDRLIKEARKRYLQKEKAADDTTLCIAYLRGCSGNHHKV
jgi:hypothetical protein